VLDQNRVKLTVRRPNDRKSFSGQDLRPVAAVHGWLTDG
jgi:hypothetical protein